MELRSRQWTAIAVSLTLAAGPVLGACSRGDDDELATFPNAMAAIGDSITQAANTDRRNVSGSNPEHSWSTGSDADDAVVSHYERILRENRRIRGRNFNDAVSGARIDDAPGQAAKAVEQRAEYVTVAIGANDLCTSAASTMTPVAAFESQFRRTMQALVSGLPESRILVLSIPDVYRLWSVLRDHTLARLVWRTFRVCPSMLSRSNTESDRQAVRERNREFNRVLRSVCADYDQCRFDGLATFRHRFERADVSSVDFFHPSLRGQAKLAEVSWNAGYWADQ